MEITIAESLMYLFIFIGIFCFGFSFVLFTTTTKNSMVAILQWIICSIFIIPIIFLCVGIWCAEQFTKP